MLAIALVQVAPTFPAPITVIFDIIQKNLSLLLFCSFAKKSTMNSIAQFRTYRAKMNKVILDSGSLFFKRFFNLDTRTYEEGALSAQTKEMLGLVSSLVLRCDDCVKYHIEKCYELGVTREQAFEVFAVANLVGGSIVIPHTRRAIEYWDLLEENNKR